MKASKIIFTIFLSLFIVQTTNAQFLKKLKKKVEERVEQKITDKVADKASEKAGKTIDKVFDSNFKKNSPIPIGGEQGSIDDVPSEYQFEWVYKMTISSSRAKGTMDIEYYLKKDAAYWGAKMNQGMELFMVYDMTQMLTVMFMESSGQKMASVTKISEEDTYNDMDSEMLANDDYTITEIDGKTILGYKCKGYEIENSKYKFTLYNTFETEVSFSDIYGKNDQLPKGFNMDWLKEGDNEGLVMEMILEDKESDKNNMTMHCTKLERLDYTIYKKDYNSIGG